MGGRDHELQSVADRSDNPLSQSRQVDARQRLNLEPLMMSGGGARPLRTSA